MISQKKKQKTAKVDNSGLSRLLRKREPTGGAVALARPIKPKSVA